MSPSSSMQRFALRLVRSAWTQTAAGVALWAGSTLSGQAQNLLPESPGAVAPKATAPAAAAQQQASVTTFHLNKRTIVLPIQLEDKYRPQLQEIQLWYKESPTAPWTLRDKAPATQTSFNFQAPRDGEYLFTMVTVDRQGKSTPADLSKEEPAMAVIVDTQAPALDIMLLGAVPEGQLIQCDVRDAHLDAARTRMQYQTADKVFRDLDPVPDRVNTWCIPGQANITGQLRFCAADLAGNVATKECSLAQLTASAKPGVTPPSTVTPPVAVASEPKVSMPAAEKIAGPNLLPGAINNTPNLVTAPGGGVLQGPPLTEGTTSKASEPATGAVKQASVAGQPLPSHDPLTPQVLPGVAQSTPMAPTVTPLTAPKQGAPIQQLLVNGTRLFLDYRTEKAGPSGVGRVEVWCTRDKGQSWQKIGESHDRKSPVEVQLPGDGVYGLTLVASNGLGFGAQAPGAGDAPDWCIEVDTTRPTAQLTSVKLSPTDGPAVHIAWTCQDRNLGTGPVELSYAASRQGPWLPIAKNLRGDGEHRWTPPTDIGQHAYIRLAARDLAGNTTITETTHPVTLDDMSRPLARIVGITTDAGLVNAPKTGN